MLLFQSTRINLGCMFFALYFICLLLNHNHKYEFSQSINFYFRILFTRSHQVVPGFVWSRFLGVFFLHKKKEKAVNIRGRECRHKNSMIPETSPLPRLQTPITEDRQYKLKQQINLSRIHFSHTRHIDGKMCAQNLTYHKTRHEIWNGNDFRSKI